MAKSMSKTRILTLTVTLAALLVPPAQAQQRKSLFQVLFQLQNAPIPETSVPGGDVRLRVNCADLDWQS